MSLVERIANIARSVTKSKENKSKTPKKVNKSEEPRWQNSNLNKLKRIMEHNKGVEERGAKTGGKDLDTGKKIPASHYKKNLELTKQGIDRIKKEISNQKKANILKKTAMTKQQYKVSPIKKKDAVDRNMED